MKGNKLLNKLKRKILNKSQDKFIQLNDVFSYGINQETAHIHMPKRIDVLIKEKGIHYAIELINENLYEALNRLAEIAEKNPNIKNVFAVSPLLSQKEFRERLEILGFRTEPADKKFEKIFPNNKNLYQASIPIERLKQVLRIEKEARDGMDTHSEIFHNRLLYYKYKQLKEIGIINYYDIPLDKIIDMGKMNYNYRHGLPLETKAELRKKYDTRNNESQRETIKDEIER